MKKNTTEPSLDEAQKPCPAILVGVLQDGEDVEEMELCLKELSRLADTAGLSVVAFLTQAREHVHGATVIGKGKLKELSDLCETLEAQVVVFDFDLSPSQIKNIEDAVSTDVRVIDRTMLILDIFAASAKTGEGMLQVEIAQLKYNVPRLTGKGKELSRLGGGIGTRGPGESKLETDRRHVRRKIAALEKRLETLASSRRLQRKSRRFSGVPQIAIAGYTNAGKSTLLNYLTDAGILAQDKLFATLDPTTRRMRAEGIGEVLFTDTVGFIDRLPHHLVEAFSSTLDEVAYADLVLVVLDASDEALDRQLSVTRTLLSDVFADRGVPPVPVLYAYNKCDLIDGDTPVVHPSIAGEECVFLSARTGAGVRELLEAIARILQKGRKTVTFRFPGAGQEKLDLLYRTSAVESVEYSDDFVTVVACADEKTRGKLSEFIV